MSISNLLRNNNYELKAGGIALSQTGIINTFKGQTIQLLLTGALSQTVTVYAVKIGNSDVIGASMCILHFQQGIGPATANTTINFAGLPVDYRPANYISQCAPGVMDNSVFLGAPGSIQILADGTGRIGKSFLLEGADPFTAAGDCGFEPFSICYAV